MGSALIQRNDRLEEAAATAFLSTFAAGLCLALFALALSPLVGLYFDSHEIGLLSAALSGVLLINAATVVPDALLRRRFSFMRLVIINPINAVVYGVAGVVTLAMGMGAWGLVIATYATCIARLAALWILNRWLPDLRKASWAMWRELARYARHVVLGEFIREFSVLTNIALVGRFLGVGPLGAYRAGWRLATEAVNPLVASAYVLLPAFARLAHDPIRLRQSVLRSVRLLAAVVIPVSVAVLVLGEEIGVTLLGEPWREAGRVLAGLAGVTLALGFIQPASEVFKAADRPDLLPRLVLISSVGSVVLMIAFLPFGATGVAVGVSIAFLLSAAYAWRQVGRVLGIPLRTLGGLLIGPTLASVGMAAALLVLLGYTPGAEDSGAVQLGWLVFEGRRRCARLRCDRAQDLTGDSRGPERGDRATSPT